MVTITNLLENDIADCAIRYVSDKVDETLVLLITQKQYYIKNNKTNEITPIVYDKEDELNTLKKRMIKFFSPNIDKPITARWLRGIDRINVSRTHGKRAANEMIENIIYIVNKEIKNKNDIDLKTATLHGHNVLIEHDWLKKDGNKEIGLITKKSHDKFILKHQWIVDDIVNAQIDKKAETYATPISTSLDNNDKPACTYNVLRTMNMLSALIGVKNTVLLLYGKFDYDIACDKDKVNEAYKALKNDPLRTVNIAIAKAMDNELNSFDHWFDAVSDENGMVIDNEHITLSTSGLRGFMLKSLPEQAVMLPQEKYLIDANYASTYRYARDLFETFIHELNEWTDTINMQIILAKHNKNKIEYTKYPNNLISLHNRVSKQINLIKDEITSEQIQKTAQKYLHLETSGTHNDVEWKAEVANSSQWLCREGQTQNNCVASYANKMARGKCVIVGIRIKPDTIDTFKPYITIEVNDRNDGKLVVVQALMAHNVRLRGIAQDIYDKWLSATGAIDCTR